MKQVSGMLAVQCKWVPANSSEFKGIIQNEVDLMKLQPTCEQFTGTIVEKGMLEVTIVASYLNEQRDKVQCQLVLPYGTSEKFTAKYDVKKNPYWGKKVFEEIKPIANK